MTKEEFVKEYCTLCGTQRCYGEEYCGKYRELVLNEQSSIPKFSKLQYVYRYDEEQHYISVYCDGWLTEKKIIKSDNEANTYLNKLDKEGYKHAFTDEDVELAKEQYEYTLANKLVEREK